MRTSQTVPRKESRCISVAPVSPILSLVSAFPSTLVLAVTQGDGKNMEVRPSHLLKSSLTPLGLHLPSAISCHWRRPSSGLLSALILCLGSPSTTALYSRGLLLKLLSPRLHWAGDGGCFIITAAQDRA